MVPQQLLDYIRNYLNQGYSEQSLRPFLQQNGWPPEVINEAFNIVYGRVIYPPSQQSRPSEHTVHIKGLGLIAVVLIAIVAIVGIIIYLLVPSSPDNSMLLDYKISVPKVSKEVMAGDELRFDTIISNMGSEHRYDLFITYTITATDGKVVESWKESKAVETIHEYTVTKVIPSDMAPGKYVLEGSIDYGDDKHAVASDSFVVKKEEVVIIEPDPTCEDGILNQGEEDVDCGGPCEACVKPCVDCDDNNLCTRDLCKEGECTHIPITPCCGDGICSENEVCLSDCKDDAGGNVKVTAQSIKKEAMEIALTDLELAGKYCADLEKEVDRDYCYRIVAHGIDNKNFCRYIVSSSTKDFCYMKFATKKDASVCNEISNAHLKQACESLQR